jgi:tetratricopeptide (TPR) repeat protein
MLFGAVGQTTAPLFLLASQNFIRLSGRMTQAAQIDPGTRDALQQMVALARSGALDQARKVGKDALPKVSDAAPLHALLGRLACEGGDFADGMAHLRIALEKIPDEIFVRCDLAAALINSGDFDGVLEVCSKDRMIGDRSLQIGRFRGYAAQELGRFDEAIEAYRHVVAAASDDAGTWNNLGNALSAAGYMDNAIDALQRAARLDPQAAPTRLNLAAALASAGRPEEAIEVLRRMTVDFPGDAKPWAELGRLADWLGQDDMALEAMEEAAKRAPDDPQIHVDLGNYRGAAWDVDGAERAHRAAIAIDPSHGDAYVALAILYEHGNRADKLPGTLREAEQANIDSGLLSLIQAYVYRRDKDWQAALDAALAARDDRDPVRRAQIIGESLERLGRPDEAFPWFETMNRLVAEGPRNPTAQAGIYRNMVETNRSTLTAGWFNSWTPAFPPQEDERPSPVFLLGFPRSGTTLLDTMLMGDPSVQVMEERPAIVHVEQRLGDIGALAGMDQPGIRAARQEYWQEAGNYVDLRPDSMLVDKSPLYLNKTAIIHRLFPEAKIILALRHPMDVVLSCYITNFRPNPAMANFLDLRQAAEMYDQSMAAFDEARKLLGLQVYEVAYERMVSDRDSELRPLFDWLGLDWNDAAVDHQATAAKRGIISTASYAQVHEPLYTRATGRWARYAKQLEPVREILAPWVERFGYSLDDPAKLPERGVA